MKVLKLALAAALVLSLANADGKAKEFKFSGAKTSALLAKCSKKDAAACYEAAMRYELGGRGVVRNRLKAQGFFADACELATLAERRQGDKMSGAGEHAMSDLRERAVPQPRDIRRALRGRIAGGVRQSGADEARWLGAQRKLQR